MTNAGDWVPVERTEDRGELLPVYNLHVAKCHTYFVRSSNGGPPVLVHNDSGDPIQAMQDRNRLLEYLTGGNAGHQANRDFNKTLGLPTDIAVGILGTANIDSGATAAKKQFPEIILSGPSWGTPNEPIGNGLAIAIFGDKDNPKYKDYSTDPKYDYGRPTPRR